jgi:4,5-dihydroxyphthalate decarboxylase
LHTQPIPTIGNGKFLTTRKKAMTDLRMTFACGLYDRMLPLYTREVRPEGIDLQFVAIDSPREVFDRMTGGTEFDAAEFSITEFAARLAVDRCPFVAIPVFPSRAFRHGAITINERLGIRAPNDLEGRRIGVPLYSMTAAVWIRAHLQHDYGVDLSTVTWVEGSMDSAAKYGNPNVMPLATPVRIEAARPGASLGDLLEGGEIAAAIGTGVPAAIKRSPDLRRLFPDYRIVERDYFLRTGIFPIMHLVAIRREVYEAHPFVAKSLYDAFCKSKAVAMARMRDTIALRYMLPWLPAHVEDTEDVFGQDAWPYGVDANRPTLEALMAYLAEQGLTERPTKIEDIFVPIDC